MVTMPAKLHDRRQRQRAARCRYSFYVILALFLAGSVFTRASGMGHRTKAGSMVGIAVPAAHVDGAAAAAAADNADTFAGHIQEASQAEALSAHEEAAVQALQKEAVAARQAAAEASARQGELQHQEALRLLGEQQQGAHPADTAAAAAAEGLPAEAAEGEPAARAGDEGRAKPAEVVEAAREQGSAEPQGQQRTAQPAAGAQATPAPGACFAHFPWIPGALDAFFEHAWRAHNATEEPTSEASIAAIDAVMYSAEYHPGHDVVTLRYDDGAGRYALHFNKTWPPNKAYKRECQNAVLVDAVERHNEELQAALGRRELKFVIGTEDFGMTWRGARHRLPAFSMCTDSDHSDIPIPDFTFKCYPEARYRNTSWPAVAALLDAKSDQIRWKDREAALFHRSHWGVGPRQGLMPLLKNMSAAGTDVGLLGAALDVEDTGWESSSKDTFVFLDGLCDHKYSIHTAGFSYSASLKYKLACGNLVFKFKSKYVEFYEPGLRDDVNVVELEAGEHGVDEAQFMAVSVPRIKEVVSRTLHAEELPPIAAAGQRFAMEQLSPEALSCYWFGALMQYSELYFHEDKGEEAEARRGATPAAEAVVEQQEWEQPKDEADEQQHPKQEAPPGGDAAAQGAEPEEEAATAEGGAGETAVAADSSVQVASGEGAAGADPPNSSE